MTSPIEIPDFVPEAVQASHLQSARRDVAASRRPNRQLVADPSTFPDRLRAAGTGRVAAIATGASMGLLGLVAFSLMWTWLALTDGSLWLPFAIGGWTVTAAVPGVAAAVWWHRTGRPPARRPDHQPG